MKRGFGMMGPVMAALGLTPALVAEEAPSFTRDVQPLMMRNCLECHNGTKIKGGFNQETYETVMKGGRNGRVIVAGKPDESRLILALQGKVKHPDLGKRGKKPKADEIDVLRGWIAAGAKDDTKQSPTAGDARSNVPATVRNSPTEKTVSAAPQVDGQELAKKLKQRIDPADSTLTSRPSAAISLTQAIAIAEKTGKGEAVKAERKHDDGQLYFRIELLSPDGASTRLRINSSGKVKAELEAKAEKAEHRDRGKKKEEEKERGEHRDRGKKREKEHEGHDKEDVKKRESERRRERE